MLDCIAVATPRDNAPAMASENFAFSLAISLTLHYLCLDFFDKEL